MTNRMTKTHWPGLRLIILIIMVVLAGAGLLYWRSLQPRRVHRGHAQTVAGEFEYLTRRFDFHPPWDSWQSRIRAEEDLDELEWLLENRYSYLQRKDVDYKAALDSIRCSLGDGIQRSSFGYQLSKFIALFGDGHSRVASSSVRLQSLCTGFPPLLVGESNGLLVAFKPEWTPPRGQFSPWHYFIVSPAKDEGYYHYNKPVVMVMNRGNFSACDIFLGAFKGLKNVILIGRPSGGGSGCTGEYRLHNSEIRIYIISNGLFPTERQTLRWQRYPA
jgi:hypothetical protein